MPKQNEDSPVHKFQRMYHVKFEIEERDSLTKVVMIIGKSRTFLWVNSEFNDKNGFTSIYGAKLNLIKRYVTSRHFKDDVKGVL